MTVPERLVEAVDDRIVVLAGAGVSAAPPASLPNWNELNRSITRALGDRVDEYLGRDDYTQELRDGISFDRSSGRCPPDLQAQIINEICGEDYFRSLQCVDVDVRSRAHDAIAWLAVHGVLAAVVTTNFDCLLEQALAAHGADVQVAYDDESCVALLRALDAGATTGLPVVKVHGSVTDRRSLVDTLQQRLLGRNEALNEVLRRWLRRHHWLYAGFSAGDLEADPDYLQIAASVGSSPGCTYVVWPGNPTLSAGAQQLLSCYGDRADTIVAEVDELVARLGRRLGWGGMPVPPRDVEPTRPLIDARLRSWAHDLHPAAAVNGLAALAEAAGRTEAAFDLLHRFWRDVIGSDRTGPDFERFRCLHGRLGMGQGLLSLAEDLDSDAGMESLQNLLRLHADGSSTAGAWAALTFMWAGRVAEGFPFLGSTTELVMHRIEHPTDEAVDARSEIDGWLALAEALYILGEAEPLLETWRSYVELADRDGDLPRQALVTAMAAFVVAEFDPESYPELRDGLVAAVMEAAHRLHLPAVRGFVELAEARYWTKLIEGQRAVEHFDAAVQAMTEAARMTWRGFALVQHAKALLDTGDHERADEQLDEAFPLVDRFPALGVWFGEARGQWNRALGHEEFARRNFEAAVSRAEEMGMPRRAEHLGRYLT